MKHILTFLSIGLQASVFGQSPEYTMTIESSAAASYDNGNVYRFYVNAQHDSDKLLAVFGNDQDNLIFQTPAGIYNDLINASWSAAGLNPAIIAVFPDLADDSFATIGLDRPAANTPGAEDPSLVQDETLTPRVSDYFLTGGTNLNVSTFDGAVWYLLNTAANALPIDGRWLVAQITTTGDISGQINFQLFPLGVDENQVLTSIVFDGAGTYSQSGVVAGGCMDSDACNYDPAANLDDGSCEFPEGACDCDGNTLDATGVCGGSCIQDDNMNGICDDIEVPGCTNPTSCNYNPAANVDDGNCEGFPMDFCDCDSTVPDTDNDGVCDEDEILGCDDPLACNYDVTATENDGSCDYCSCPAASGCNDANALNFGVSDSMGCLFLNARINAPGYSMYFQHVGDTLVPSWINYGCGDLSNDDLNMRIIMTGAVDYETELDPIQIVIYSQGQEFAQLGNLQDWLTDYWSGYPEETYEYEVSFDAVSYPDSIGFFFDFCHPTIVKLSEHDPTFEDASLEVVSSTQMTLENYPYQDTISIQFQLDPAIVNLANFQVSELLVRHFQTSETGGTYNSYWGPNNLGENELDSLGAGVYRFKIPYEFVGWWGDNVCSPLLVYQVTLPSCYAGILAETTVELDISKIGCGDPEACNYDYFPCGHVGECDYESCAGCGDPYASNFSFAFVDDGSCEYPWEGCVGSSALTGHPMLSSLFYNYDEETYPVSWLTEIQPFFLLSDSNWSNWGTFNAQEQLWLSNVWEDGGGWNAFYEGSLSMPYDQSFNPGSPTVLPFDSIAVGEGVLEDESIVMCVPKFLSEPLSGLPFGLSSLELDSVVGMPPGLSLEFSDSLYSSLSAACIPIVGEAQETGCFPITIVGQATVTLFGQPIAFNDLEVDYKICVGDLSGSIESTCQDSTACNFGELGLDCLFLDECGDCGGSGIEEGACDCDGNVLDALGMCGGECSGDEDNDGVCDDVDDCIGELDSCGICGGGNTACMGCTYHEATNFNQASVVDDGSCVFDLGDSCQGDLNYDSVIGIDDILLMLSVYDTTCPQ